MIAFDYFLILLFSLFFFFRIRTLMLFFQGEEYENINFLKCISRKGKLLDKITILPLLAIYAVSFISPYLRILAVFPPVFSFLRERKFLKNAKKKLQITYRVKRIWITSYILLNFTFAGLLYGGIPIIICGVFLLFVLPVFLVIANIILYPLESFIRKGFINSAKKKLDECRPTVIGITGSYGKTSVKHFLGAVLSSCSNTLYTAGTINTLMGVCRVINTELKPEHKFFIVEMGAYYKGSIRRLCDLVKPSAAIITSIGLAHLERFKTVENTASAKFELAEAVRQNNPNGLVVLNKNKIAEKFLAKDTLAIKVGDGEKYFFTDVVQGVDGISFVFHKADELSLPIAAKVYGKHNAEDMALAIALALEMGVPASTIAAALKNVKPVKNRLQPLQIGKLTVLDDGYNSNPDGFTNALNILSVYKKAMGGRAILVTPGIIELGKKHDEIHAELGKKAAEKADVVLAVIPERITSFINAFKEKAPAESLILPVQSKDKAWEWLLANATEKDIILFENDLPDTYESDFAL